MRERKYNVRWRRARAMIEARALVSNDRKVNVQPVWSHSSKLEDLPHFQSFSVDVIAGADLSGKV